MIIRSYGSALAAAALGLLALQGPAAAADAAGTWVRPSGASHIRIAPCGSALCGDIVWLKTPRNDDRNPDPAKRSNPLLGARIVYDMQPTGQADTWKGKVYNAENGKTYNGFITMDGPDRMKLEGCVLGGLACKGETWSRVK